MKLLTAFYDLEHGPVSYDFGVWLVRAEAERIAQGCERLHVVIVPKEDGLGGFARHWGAHDAAATRWRLWRIVLAMCPLVGATVTLAATRAQARERLAEGAVWWPQGKAHFLRPLVEAARAGAEVPRLRATQAARRYVARWFDANERVVTLTLRNQATDPARNSDGPAWDAMHAWLVMHDWNVIVLGDTNDALGEALGCFGELDADLRLALYERAQMNLAGNNGPQTLLWFSEAPYMVFGAAMPADPYRAHWREHQALEWGDQMPWARPDQRLVYAPDDFATMREAFEGWDGDRAARGEWAGATS